MAIRFLSAESIDGNATFAGDVGVGNSGTFDDPNSYARKIEITAASPVGLILNDTRDTNPMSIDNSGAVMNLRYNTTSMLSLDGATSNATFAGTITASKNQNATSSFTFQNTDTTGTSVRTHLNATAGNRSIRLEAIHNDYSYVVSNNARMYLQTNSGSNNTLFLDGNNATFAGTVSTGATSGGNSGGLTIAGGITQTFQGSGATTTFNTHTNSSTASGSTDASAFLISQKNTSGSPIEYRQGVIANGKAFFGAWSSGSITGIGLEVSTGNVTFSGDVTVYGTMTFDNVINAVRASFVSTATGLTVVSAEGAYAASGSVKLYEAKRTGGAVGGDWSYDDATTDMSLGTNTNHAFALKTNNTRALTISNAQNATFAGDVSVNNKIELYSDGTLNWGAAHDSGRLTFDTGIAIVAGLSGKSLVLRSNGSGSSNTALTLDTSQNATFAGSITVGTGNSSIEGDLYFGANADIFKTSGNLTLDVAGNIILDADGGFVAIKDGGTEIGNFGNSSSDFAITASVQDKDILFKGNDNGSVITALTLDMSEGGNATFAGDVTIGSAGAGSDKILNILTGGSDSTIKLMEAGTVYGFSQVYSGANNQFYIKRHSNSATGTAVITLNRDDDNATFAGDIIVPNGKISTIGGNNLTLSGSVADHAGISFATNSILPCVVSAITNNVVDLGQNGNAYKDLYLGGEIISGGGATFTGDITGVGATFLGAAASGAPLVTIENNSGSTATSYGLLVKGGGNSSSGKTFEVRDDSGNTDLMVTGAGNVGIGTTTPQKNVEIKGAASVYTTLRITSGSTTHGSDIEFGDASDADYGSILQFATSAGEGGRMRFVAGGTETMNLRGGNVGIGVTVPSSVLHIKDNTANATQLSIQSNDYSRAEEINFLNPSTSAISGQIKYYTNPTVEYMSFSTSNNSAAAERMRITAAGNVGIGVTDPNAYYGKQLVVAAADESGITIMGTASNQKQYLCWASNSTGANAYAGFIAYDHNTNSMSLATNGGAGAITIDNAQKVGIGTTAPTKKLTVNAGSTSSDGINITGSSSPAIHINETSGTVNSSFQNDGAGSYLGTSTSHPMIFKTANTERMRILSGGNVYVGTTTPAYSSAKIVSEFNGVSNNGILISDTSSIGVQNMIVFAKNGSEVGTVTSSTSATNYNTSSDYRLKENVVSMTDALDRVSQLKPSRFNFIADSDKTVDGFLAHEVQEIVPEAITGEKDAVDEEGNLEYQGIDQSKLVPLLVGAIQELKARVKELEKNK